MGLLGFLTATLTATSADDDCAGRVVRGIGRAKGVAEDVDGLALEAEPYVGVDADGDADVGVPEEFLGDDEFDALFQEQFGGRVEVEVLPVQAEQFALAETGVESNFEQGVQAVFVRGGEELPGFVDGEGFALQGGLEHGMDGGERDSSLR